MVPTNAIAKAHKNNGLIKWSSFIFTTKNLNPFWPNESSRSSVCSWMMRWGWVRSGGIRIQLICIKSLLIRIIRVRDGWRMKLSWNKSHSQTLLTNTIVVSPLRNARSAKHSRSVLKTKKNCHSNKRLCRKTSWTLVLTTSPRSKCKPFPKSKYRNNS